MGLALGVADVAPAEPDGVLGMPLVIERWHCRTEVHERERGHVSSRASLRSSSGTGSSTRQSQASAAGTRTSAGCEGSAQRARAQAPVPATACSRPGSAAASTRLARDAWSPLGGQAGAEGVCDAVCLARGGGQGVAGEGTSVGVRIVEARKEQVDIGGCGVACRFDGPVHRVAAAVTPQFLRGHRLVRPRRRSPQVGSVCGGPSHSAPPGRCRRSCACRLWYLTAAGRRGAAGLLPAGPGTKSDTS